MAIEKAQTLFMNRMSSVVTKHGVIIVGYKGGSDKHEAYWSKDLGIWWMTEKAENRYWNAFGVDEPKWHTTESHSITCEINPPFKGINRRIAGAFAIDAVGRICLLHRGRIGGGKEGIGKTKFRNAYQDKWQQTENGNVVNEFALIGFLDDPHFPQQVVKFIYEVARIKSIP